MKDGFIRVSAVTPDVVVADTEANGRDIRNYMEESAKSGSLITVFPELSVTGYTCGDLFFQETLLSGAATEVRRCAEVTKDLPGIFFIGAPVPYSGRIYNSAIAIANGRIEGIVPKTFIPNYHEFYERRQFAPGCRDPFPIDYAGFSDVPFGSNIIFKSRSMPDLSIACELCEDLWVPNPPSIRHALNGADVIVNLSASNEITGKADYRRELVKGQSARLYCAYIYASSGETESTSDLVFSGHDIISQAGRIISEKELFKSGMITGVIDTGALMTDRRETTTFGNDGASVPAAGYVVRDIDLPCRITSLDGMSDRVPFVPSDPSKRNTRCREITDIQARGLMKRLLHTHANTAVIGISGGLDSTLACLVTARAMDLIGMDHSHITAVTMPGFGTTDRTYNNAVNMVRSLGCTLKEISITAAVDQHFKDIDQDPSVHDVTYENSQARERTQILMDIANKEGGLVIGTGDLSELALGWDTYNGDHMSMYGVNVSVPKTLVRYLVNYFADKASDDLAKVLYDVLDTPVSPELLPPENGTISQKTEDLVGPYELHDFFLYYLMRYGFMPHKIMRLAENSFNGIYDRETILKWMKTFYRRFFAQQFKRNCLPDGPKVGTVALSPRGDWRMPSDASWNLFKADLETMIKES
jgi:NAD+ synthase (glutamine-hydrolysing)